MNPLSGTLPRSPDRPSLGGAAARGARGWGGCLHLLHPDPAFFIPGTNLGRERESAQEGIHRFGDVSMDGELVARLDLDQHIEGGRSAALEHGLLRAAAAGFLVRKRDRLDTADQVGQGGVEQQVLERLAMCRTDELHAAFGNGAGSGGLELAPDLVDDDHLGIVILDRLDHHLVLQHRLTHLHAPGAPDGGVRHIAVAADLIGRVDNDHAPAFRQDARGLAQQGGLAHARLAEDENAFAALDDVLDDFDGAVDGAPDAQRQPDDVAAPVADGRDAVQRALDAGAVVRVELADAFIDVCDVFCCDLRFTQHHFALDIACRGDTPEVNDDLEQPVVIVRLVNRVNYGFREYVKEGVQIVSNATLL